MIRFTLTAILALVLATFPSKVGKGEKRDTFGGGRESDNVIDVGAYIDPSVIVFTKIDARVIAAKVEIKARSMPKRKKKR